MVLAFKNADRVLVMSADGIAPGFSAIRESDGTWREEDVSPSELYEGWSRISDKTEAEALEKEAREALLSRS